MASHRLVQRFRTYAQRMACRGSDPGSLEIEPVSGGVSNTSFFWRCRDLDGDVVEYFVKVFLLIGTL